MLELGKGGIPASTFCWDLDGCLKAIGSSGGFSSVSPWLRIQWTCNERFALKLVTDEILILDGQMVKGTTVLGRIQVQHLSQLMISPTYRVPRPRKRFFCSKQKGMFCENDDGQGNLCFREVVFFFGGWNSLYGFFMIFPFFLGQKVPHLSRPCWSKQRWTPPQRTVGPRHQKVLRRVVILPPFLLQPPAALLLWCVSLEIAPRIRDQCWPRDSSQVRHG